MIFFNYHLRALVSLLTVFSFLQYKISLTTWVNLSHVRGTTGVISPRYFNDADRNLGSFHLSAPLPPAFSCCLSAVASGHKMAAVPPRLMISLHVEEERGVTTGRRTRDMTAKSTSFSIKDVSMFLEPLTQQISNCISFRLYHRTSITSK